jgi:hypothetical protein
LIGPARRNHRQWQGLRFGGRLDARRLAPGGSGLRRADAPGALLHLVDPADE